MKKLSLLFIAMVALAINDMNAQGAYVSLRAGYAVDATSEVQGTEFKQNADGTFTMDNVYGTTGGGANIGLGLGYMISEHFGVELGVGYFMSAKDEQSSSELIPVNITDPIPVSGNIESSTTETTYSRQLRIAPALVVSGGSEGLKPYARFGIVLPVTGTTTREIRNNQELDQTLAGFLGLAGYGELKGSVKADAEVKGAFSVGFQSAIGVNYAISDADDGMGLSVFGELEYTGLTIKGNTRELVAYEQRYTMDGEALDAQTAADLSAATGQALFDVNLSDLPRSSVMIDYVDQTDENTNVGQEPTKNGEELAPRSNYGSIGINVGVRLNF